VGDGEDGVGEVVSCEKPADDGDGLLIAAIALPVDQDDAVHVIVALLKSHKNYIRPYFTNFLCVAKEEFWGNFVVH
jgi:hypothetical protein